MFGHHVRPYGEIGRTISKFGRTMSDDRLLFPALQSDIFLHQAIDNDDLVILDIIVTRITCNSIVLVNFNKEKLNNSKISGKTDR